MKFRRNQNLKVERSSYKNRNNFKSNPTKNRVFIVVFCLVITIFIGFLGYQLINKRVEPNKGKTPTTTDSLDKEIKDKASESPKEPEQEPEPEQIPEVKDDPNITGYTSKNVFIYNNEGFELFGGSEAMAKKYAAILNAIKAKLGTGVKVYNMVVPTHAEFGLPPKHKKLTNSQKENIDAIYSQYSENGVIPVDAYKALQMHSNQYIYFHTDHHWTSLGASYAFNAFAKVAGEKPVDLQSLTKKTIPDFVGYLYTASKDNTLKNNPDHVDYYEIPGNLNCSLWQTGATDSITVPLYAERASGGNAYSVYLHGDSCLMTIKHTDDNKNGKKIMLVGESYKNAFGPFLALYYKEVHVVDLRHSKADLWEYVKQNGIDEVIILNYTMAANTGQMHNHLKNRFGAY
ncbi:MAG: hypothetical protein LBJ95_02430 [Oscillospiraceae bacterium]|jgi:hypothetical protein|nr:hypothetical protein [Oscillospiraceae bacterium]